MSKGCQGNNYNERLTARGRECIKSPTFLPSLSLPLYNLCYQAYPMPLAYFPSLPLYSTSPHIIPYHFICKREAEQLVKRSRLVASSNSL